MKLFITALAALVVVWGASRAQATAITITIDYTYDTNNFFDTQAKRDLMQDAANAVAVRLNDSLSAITPGPTDTWNEALYNPSTGVPIDIPNPTVAANNLVIYAGAYSLGAGVLGQGSPGGYDNVKTFSPQFLSDVSTRGQGNTLGPAANDFGPWGGSVSFNNTATNWNFSTAPPASNQYDFLSVAEHEVLHVLGFGTSASWNRIGSGSTFLGAAATAANGGVNPPLSTTDFGHWASGTMSDGRTAVMDPALLNGTRSEATTLDFAALQDIGWKVGPPGDVNGDGIVNIADLTAVGSAWLTNGPQYDVNLDGIVNIGDLTLIGSNWLQSVGGGSGTSLEVSGVGVPEPGTFGLAATAAGLAVAAGWRSSRRRTLGAAAG